MYKLTVTDGPNLVITTASDVSDPTIRRPMSTAIAEFGPGYPTACSAFDTGVQYGQLTIRDA